MNLNLVDAAVIVLYFALVLGAGVWFQRRAARGLDAYFLGGKNIPWLALAVSGASSMFDVTGTMWIVTLIVLFGFKSMWNHWMWGFLMGAFFMSFMGKWVRRSGVITGAEWMVTRFGDRRRRPHRPHRLRTDGRGHAGGVPRILLRGDRQVRLGRTSPAGYPARAAWLPWRIFARSTTVYVLLGGLYSVVVTDLIQTAILTLPRS